MPFWDGATPRREGNLMIYEHTHVDCVRVGVCGMRVGVSVCRGVCASVCLKYIEARIELTCVCQSPRRWVSPAQSPK